MAKRTISRRPSRRKPPSNDEILAQVQALLEGPDDDLTSILLREMLQGVLKLRDSRLTTLDLKILNRTLKELRSAFRMFQPYRDCPKVSFFGSARTPPDDPNYQMAVRFAQLLVQHGYMVVTGGADGIMRAGHEGAGREHSFGVNIMLPFEQGANTVIENDPKLYTFRYFFTRKLLFVKESHAAVLFPGGFGTHDEGFELLTLVQTGKTNPQPIVCLEAPGTGYWEAWYRFVTDQLLARGLISKEDLHLFKLFDAPEAAIEEITAFYRHFHSIRFVGRQLVIRIKHPVAEEQLRRINADFADMLERGAIEQRGPLPEELDEPVLKDLPRLVCQYNRRSAGRLRQLIDAINRVTPQDALPKRDT